MSELPTTIGRYQVVGRIATGGMAEIFLARVLGPSGFDRPVVLKRVLPHLARDERFVDMFLDEARTVARIRHPNVVHVHELGRDNNQLFLVMEYLEGESAEVLLRRLRSQSRQLPHALAAHIVAEAAAGLHAAHELTDERGELVQLVHRDMSPHNVIVTYAGQVKVIDFGIARTAERIARTEAGQVKGKFAYMSPEQCLAEPLDRRSDVFSLGIVLFELLAGRRLFKRHNDLLTLRAICQDPIPRISDVDPSVPPRVDEIVAKALRRAPAERWPTAGAMRRELSLLIRELPLDDAPSELLAALMRELFEERLTQKEALVRRVRSGSSVGSMPAAEVDHHVTVPELASSAPGGGPPSQGGANAPPPSAEAHAGGTPSVAAQSVSPADVAASSPRPTAREGRRARLLLGLVAAALGLGAAAGGLVLRRAQNLAAAPSSSTPTPALPAGSGAGTSVASGDVDGGSTMARAGGAEQVTVKVVTTPAGARVWLDGVDQGETPLELALPKGDGTLRLVVRHPGFEAWVEEVVPTSDLKLQLALRPERSGGSGAPAPRGTSSKGFRRFD